MNSLEQKTILDILQNVNEFDNKKKFGDYNVENFRETFRESGASIEAVKRVLIEQDAKEIVELNIDQLKVGKFRRWLKVNKENLTGSGGNKPEQPDKSQNSKKIILEILRGQNLNEHKRKFGNRVEVVNGLLFDTSLQIKLIEKHLTEETAKNFISTNGEVLRLSAIEKWLENNKSLLSGATENGDGPTSPEPGKKPGSPSQNGDNSQTTQPLNDNWEREVKSLISGQTDLNKSFSKLMSSWKNQIEENKKADEGAEGYNKAPERKFLEGDAFLISTNLASRIQDIEDELEKLIKDSLNVESREAIINKIEAKYHIKLSENSKKKKNFAKFLMRIALENILASDPLTQTESQNSWEKKLLDLAENSFAENAERKSVAQKVAYYLIAAHGFSTTSPAVEKKANELKNLLSQYSVSLDLNKTKEKVSKMLQVFHAGIKSAPNHSFEVSWKVPNESSHVSGLADEDNFNPALCFPVFPSVKSDEKILSKIFVREVESWDQGQPVGKDNNASETVPDVSSAKEQAAKERENKQKKEAEEVKNTVVGLNNENLPEAERFTKLIETEAKEGKKSYQSNEADIQKGKKNLFTKNSSEYRKIMTKVFRKKVADNELSEAEISKAIEEWENNQKNDWEKVKDLEKNINQKIGQAVAKKKVNAIENRIKQVLKTGDKMEMFAVLKDLLALFNDTQDDVYLSEYQNQVKKQIENLEKAISGDKTNTPPNKGFWQPKVLIPLGIGIVVVVGIIVAVVRSRRKKQVKIKKAVKTNTTEI